ncbi:asparagine synthase (glutamine-hydrolyzing), partial [Cognatilysobacter lacus]|uniref:asparagine synthase (glutamine-hydrolyzing) n=1 Tax=Cognatilysobacter lacus TaxID=1643323 RepID=UPI001659B053
MRGARMCGIGGVFSTDELPDVLLARMQDGLRHRGPDGEGRWRDPCGTAGLVHARLAIIDLTDGGAQPMRSADGRYVLVFNGEIYNYRALRAELEAGGARFSTESDTEVLLTLAAAHGIEGLRRLRGMFALALWDTHARRGLLARDGFGIKPLYYANTASGLLFASELRTLLATGAVDFRLDPVALGDFFATGSVPEPASLVEGVAVLPPGHTLSWEGGRATLERFWSVHFPPPTVSARSEAICLTRAALEDSITAHFVSDVPVGLFLSGGIDSTALLSLAARAGHASGMDTFSIAVDQASHDEAGVAAASARRFGSRHHVLRLDGGSAADSLDSFLDSMDVPSVDGFNTWTVSRFARSQGMKVVLSGLGGDEMFGGYPSFRNVPRLRALVSAARRLP